VTEAGVVDSRQVFAEAGTNFDVKRFEGQFEFSRNESGVLHVEGSVQTPSGEVSLGDFTRANGNSITAIVDANNPEPRPSSTGRTILLQNHTSTTTLAHELGHRLGNDTPQATRLPLLLRNGITDLA